MKALASLAVPPVVVTETVTAPAEPAGVVAVIEVAVSAVMVAAVEPKLTAVAPARLVPVMVTEVPPAVVPEVGEIEVMVGAAVAEPRRCRRSASLAVPAGRR